MASEKKIKDRSLRTFAMVLYPDTSAYNCESIMSDVMSNYDYAFIKHDKDVDEDGVLKKVHIHIIVSFNSPRKLSWILSRFKQTHVESISSTAAYLRYMTHSDLDDSTKYIYPDSDLHMSSKFKSIFDKEVKEINLIDLVNEFNVYCAEESVNISYKNFAFWIAKNHNSYISDTLRYAYALRFLLNNS